ncbi:hypothetical protein ADEAN_000856100 [Angomonas deanei]|uniref:Uncharacterized protein n=1 Tax=Angomonas deanei TaxID=59799 RepID=A0A7G2CPZ4_9TRYP|nr:hypothetical protein ADEAN_000856100 [Angomonas deanei]
MSDLFNYYLKNNNSSLRDVSAVQDPQDSFRKKSSSVNTINNSKNSDASSLHTVRQRSRTRSADREEPTNKRVTFTSPPENPKITTNTNNNTNVELLVQQRVEAYQTEREKKYQKQLQDAICAVHAQFANEYQSKEAQLEKQVLEEADHFKKEYKTILDAEYQSKKSLLEKQLQEKESIFMRRWVAETATNKAHPNTNAVWLEKTEKESAAVVEALQEVTALRDKLLAEQMEQKAALQVSFEERIRTLQQHYNTSLEKIQQANVKLQQEREKGKHQVSRHAGE